MMLKVILYEDNKNLRESLSVLIGGTAGFEFAGGFANCNHVLDEVAAINPDVVVMDIDMPGTNGIEGVRKIRSTHPHVHILMLTVFEDNEHVSDAILAGASGYILKRTPPSKILEAIREVHTGGAPMTPVIAKRVLTLYSQSKPNSKFKIDFTGREQEVLNLIVQGYSYKMIADRCNIGIDAVRSRIKKIYDKLHVHSMSEAVSVALKNNLV